MFPATPYSEASVFVRQMRRLEQDVLRMGALVENSCRLSHQALFEHNLVAAEAIAPLDKQIDQFYRRIELDCIQLMTLQAPVAQDTRLLGAYMQLIRDLERIGDYAKNLADIAIKLFPHSPHPCMAQIEVMSLQTQTMLATSLVALVDLDAEVGRRIKQMDCAVDAGYETVYHILAQTPLVCSNPSSAPSSHQTLEPFILLALTIRHLERMADHATNIGQRVAFIVTGQRG